MTIAFQQDCVSCATQFQVTSNARRYYCREAIHIRREAKMSSEEARSPKLQYQDIPDLKETFADSIGNGASTAIRCGSNSRLLGWIGRTPAPARYRPDRGRLA